MVATGEQGCAGRRTQRCRVEARIPKALVCETIRGWRANRSPKALETPNPRSSSRTINTLGAVLAGVSPRSEGTAHPVPSRRRGRTRCTDGRVPARQFVGRDHPSGHCTNLKPPARACPPNATARTGAQSVMFLRAYLHFTRWTMEVDRIDVGRSSWTQPATPERK